MWAAGVIFVASAILIVFSFTGKAKLVWKGTGADFGPLTSTWKKSALGTFGFVCALSMVVFVGFQSVAPVVVNVIISTQEAQQITVPLQVRDIPVLGKDVTPEGLSSLIVEEWELKTEEEKKLELLDIYRYFPANTIVTGVPTSEPSLWGELTETQRSEVIQEFTKPDTIIDFKLSSPL